MLVESGASPSSLLIFPMVRADLLMAQGKYLEAEKLLRGELREGDVLLTLGAGDIDTLARDLTAG